MKAPAIVVWLAILAPASACADDIPQMTIRPDRGEQVIEDLNQRSSTSLVQRDAEALENSKLWAFNVERLYRAFSFWKKAWLSARQAEETTNQQREAAKH